MKGDWVIVLAVFTMVGAVAAFVLLISGAFL